MNSTRRKIIENMAGSARKKCQRLLGPYGEITDIFSCGDYLDYKLIRYPIGEESLLGFIQLRDGDRVVFSNSSVRLSREVFTVAHEIGHSELHIGEKCRCLEDATFDSKKVIEQEANYFAACFLMPADTVKNCIKTITKGGHVRDAMEIVMLMCRYHVSYDMVVARLEYLQMLDQAVKEYLEREKAEKTVGGMLKIIGGDAALNQPSNIRQIPEQYLEWICSNYRRGLIPKETINKALKYFDTDVNELNLRVDVRSKEEESLEDLLGSYSEASRNRMTEN